MIVDSYGSRPYAEARAMFTGLAGGGRTGAGAGAGQRKAGGDDGGAQELHRVFPASGRAQRKPRLEVILAPSSEDSIATRISTA